MKNHLLALGALLGSTSAFAALPPYYESVRILQAILSSGDVAQRLNSTAEIETVTKRETGAGYWVSAGGCGLEVIVVFEPQDPPVVGPAPFHLEIGQLMCE